MARGREEEGCGLVALALCASQLTTKPQHQPRTERLAGLELDTRITGWLRRLVRDRRHLVRVPVRPPACGQRLLLSPPHAVVQERRADLGVRTPPNISLDPVSFPIHRLIWRSRYASRDPSNFGVGDASDAYLVARLPICAPELVELADGRVLVVAPKPQLDGFRVAELKFGAPMSAEFKALDGRRV